MSKDKSNNQLTFREAVAATPDVSNGYQEGLSALGRYTAKIRVPDLTKIDGSLNIDATTKVLVFGVFFLYYFQFLLLHLYYLVFY